MTDGYRHVSRTDIEPRPDRPGHRWEFSEPLELSSVALNVVSLPPSETLSISGFHAHEDQTELYYVFDGRCRVEAPEDRFELTAHEAVVFDPDVGHMLHNPFTETCGLFALGLPRDAHDPVRVIEDASSLLSRRDCEDPESADK